MSKRNTKAQKADPIETTATPPRLMGVSLIAAPYEKKITDNLIRGARAVLEPYGCPIEEVHVGGALEIPAAIKVLALKNGHITPTAPKTRDHIYIALGCIIRGETYHFDIVANESARAIMDLTTQDHLVIGNGILTVENAKQAKARSHRPTKKGTIKGANKGIEAANAALSVLSVWQGVLENMTTKSAT